MNDLKWNISELSVWSTQRDQLRLRLEDLLAPHTGIWPEDHGSFFILADQILDSLDPPDQSLFLSCCTASWLLDKFSAPPGFGQWAAERIETVKVPLPLPLPLNEARHWNWRRSSIILSSSGQGRLINVLYGVGNAKPGVYFPQWPQQLMDMESRKAVVTAWNMAELQEKSAVFWPMLDYVRPGGLIHGSSLGLPAYLAFRSMTSPQPVFTMGATGKICKTGRILPVHGLKLKYQAARMARLSAFIYPDQEGIRIEEAEPTEPVAVDSMEEAEAVWLHSVPGIANETALLIRSHNHGEFVRRLCRVSGSLIDWLEKKNQAVSRALCSTALAKDDLMTLLNQMDQLIKITPMPRNLLGPVLKAMNEQTLDKLINKWPDLAYRICNHQLRWASSTGDNTSSALWEEKAKACSDKAVQAGLSLDDLFLEDVLRMVGSYHNRFIFYPDPPENFASKLQAVEEMLVILRRCRPEANLKILGKYCGTMIQNLAFCGPEYLSNILEYYHKAREAFGQAKQEKDEILRLENYLTYAFLDAKQYEQAEKHLKVYLELSDFNQPVNWDEVKDPFKHACFIRFMADTDFPNEHYASWISRTWKKKPGVHPWQLWMNNGGRLFTPSDPELAGSLFDRSLKICQDFGGPTVRAMGLLSLSGLYMLDKKYQRIDLKKHTLEILASIGKSDLNQEHFACVLQAADWKSALEMADLNRRELFLFTYR